MKTWHLPRNLKQQQKCSGTVRGRSLPVQGVGEDVGQEGTRCLQETERRQVQAQKGEKIKEWGHKVRVRGGQGSGWVDGSCGHLKDKLLRLLRCLDWWRRWLSTGASWWCAVMWRREERGCSERWVGQLGRRRSTAQRREAQGSFCLAWPPHQCCLHLRTSWQGHDLPALLLTSALGFPIPWISGQRLTNPHFLWPKSFQCWGPSHFWHHCWPWGVCDTVRGGFGCHVDRWPWYKKYKETQECLNLNEQLRPLLNLRIQDADTRGTSLLEGRCDTSCLGRSEGKQVPCGHTHWPLRKPTLTWKVHYVRANAPLQGRELTTCKALGKIFV